MGLFIMAVINISIHPARESTLDSESDVYRRLIRRLKTVPALKVLQNAFSESDGLSLHTDISRHQERLSCVWFAGKSD